MLVCTFGYSWLQTLSGWDQEEQGTYDAKEHGSCINNTSRCSFVMEHTQKETPDIAHFTFTQKSKCGGVWWKFHYEVPSTQKAILS